MAPTLSLHALPTVLAAGQGAKQIGELGLAFALSSSRRGRTALDDLPGVLEVTTTELGHDAD